MEINGFWTLDKRKTIAETLLKNVDFENSYHCNMSFNSTEELANHVDNCNFRSMICENEGCNARFCTSHLKKHDSTCPFKIIQCEQKCSDSIMRREMDRHCITVCPMKIVNCPFHAVGCQSAIAQCMIEKHRSDDIQSHLWHLLKGIHKEASGEDLKRRVEQIVQASSSNRLAEARDVRSLNFIVKDIEVKLGPFKVSAEDKNNAKAVAKNGDKEDGDTNMNNSEQSIKASNMVNSSDEAEVSDMMNMNNVENTTKNKYNEPSPVANKGIKERTQTSNMENLSDKTEISILNDKNINVVASELKTKGNEESTQTNMEKLSNEEVGATNEGSAENNIKCKSNEDSKFEDKDNEKSIQNSRMEIKGGAENNVKNKDIEDGGLKKSIQTLEV
ncbi:TNF receptor-associated factor family protein [Spatholobus suberectus]|nr:TNF receptor-associated factor family protein [Spatholobus suberectus]